MPSEPISADWIKSVMDVLNVKISEIQQKHNELLRDIEAGKVSNFDISSIHLVDENFPMLDWFFEMRPHNDFKRTSSSASF